MTWPVTFHLFGLHLPAHQAFESLGYFVAARVYFKTPRKISASTLPFEGTLWLLVGAWVGSGIGH